jgi:hypothetical protein
MAIRCHGKRRAGFSAPLLFRTRSEGSGEMDQEKTNEGAKETQERADLYQRVIADLIREYSKAGKLALSEEIVHALQANYGLTPVGEGTPDGGFPRILQETMKQQGDLREIPGHDGLPRYFSEQYMTIAYARLLVRKEGDPLMLIAETVRENSKVYPRPISRDIFKNEPFALAEEEMAACLEKMKAEDQYKDIAQTVTSEGSIYLYSTLHLDPDYASMLAEWVDVGQYRNP